MTDKTFQEYTTRAIDALDQEGLIALTQEMVRIPSYCGEEGELSQYMASRLEELGFEVETQEVEPARWNVLGRIRGSGDGCTLLFNGHLDTNPVVLGWTKDPFGGEVEDGWLYGVGVVNMKAADAAFVMAAAAVHSSGIPLRGDVIVSLVVGELEGGTGTKHMVEHGIDADAFVVAEPTECSLLTLHAGVVQVKIHVIGRAVHLSQVEEGVNAIEAMTDVVPLLKQASMTCEPKPAYLGLQRKNLGVIRGGLSHDYLEWRPSIVPDYCSLTVDVRIAPGQTPDSVLEDLRRAVQPALEMHPGIRIELELAGEPNFITMLPFEVDPGEPIVETMLWAHELVGGHKPALGDVAPFKFFGTDAAHLAEAGRMPGVVYGPGGKYLTRPDERVSITQLTTAAQVYTAATVRFCSREC